MTKRMRCTVLVQANAQIQSRWQQAAHRPRMLFDAYSSEWESVPMEQKVRILKRFQAEGILDPLLMDYIGTYQGLNRHVLGGMGRAVLAYADAGVDLKMPASPVMNTVPYPFYAAGLSSLLAGDKADCMNIEWLKYELMRLQSAIPRWLAGNAQKDKDEYRLS